MDVVETLERPIGPMPLWGWLAGGIIIVGGFLVLRRSSGGGGAARSTANSAGFGTSGPPGAGAPGGQDTITGDELTGALKTVQEEWAAREQQQGDDQAAATKSAIEGVSSSLQTSFQTALGTTYNNLIDYGNAHWIGSGAAGGSAQTIIPIASPGSSGAPAIPAPAQAAAQAADPLFGTRAYTQTVSMLPGWAGDALNWFIRSDAPGNAGLAQDWQDAPESAREQLRQLLSQGYAFATPGYSGPRPL